MSFDWHANSWEEEQKGKFDCFSHIKLLKPIDETDEYNDEKYKEKQKEKYKEFIINGRYQNIIKERLELLRKLFLEKPNINLSSFPDFSFFLQFTFELATPYISRDDEEFYVCDNPIRKDKVFKVPLISASNWKGNMRWTARQIKGLDTNKPDTINITRLFGNDKSEENNFKRGRLNFYSTFLDKIDLEVINPHKRETKAGTMPIYIESAPCGTKGTFTLLYVPFDLLGKKEDALKKEVKEDLKLVCDSLKEMMLTYGFSAKKSSGFGIAKDKLENGNLIIKGSILPDIQSGLKAFQEPDEIFRKFMNENGEPKAFLKKGNGEWISGSEYNNIPEKPDGKRKYSKFRDWYNKHGSEWMSKQTGGNTSKNKLQSFPVESFTFLVDLTKKCLIQLRS